LLIGLDRICVIVEYAYLLRPESEVDRRRIDEQGSEPVAHDAK
jgi:hypothetical protein